LRWRDERRVMVDRGAAGVAEEGDVIGRGRPVGHRARLGGGARERSYSEVREKGGFEVQKIYHGEGHERDVTEREKKEPLWRGARKTRL
jgi:hypothetical protein